MKIKGVLPVILGVVGAILIVGVYQVPDAWRDALVGWLVFLVVAGVFVWRLAQQHYRGKAHTARRRIVDTPPPPRRRRASTARLGSLNAVMRQSAGSGKRSI